MRGRCVPERRIQADDRRGRHQGSSDDLRRRALRDVALRSPNGVEWRREPDQAEQGSSSAEARRLPARVPVRLVVVLSWSGPPHGERAEACRKLWRAEPSRNECGAGCVSRTLPIHTKRVDQPLPTAERDDVDDLRGVRRSGRQGRRDGRDSGKSHTTRGSCIRTAPQQSASGRALLRVRLSAGTQRIDHSPIIYAFGHTSHTSVGHLFLDSAPPTTPRPPCCLERTRPRAAPVGNGRATPHGAGARRGGRCGPPAWDARKDLRAELAGDDTGAKRSRTPTSAGTRPRRRRGATRNAGIAEPRAPEPGASGARGPVSNGHARARRAAPVSGRSFGPAVAPEHSGGPRGRADIRCRTPGR